MVEHLPFGVKLQVKEGLRCLLHRNEFATSGKELDPVMDFPIDSEVKVSALHHSRHPVESRHCLQCRLGNAAGASVSVRSLYAPASQPELSSQQ